MAAVLWDAIILSGGRSSRLGYDKDELVGSDGRTTLDRVVDACAGARRRVVVGPPRKIATAMSVTWAREEPPFSGPARAIAAGLEALGRQAGGDGDGPVVGRCDGDRCDGDGWVAAVACDIPKVASALTFLLATAAQIETTAPVEAIVAVDEEGRRQWLCALYRRSALRRAAAALPYGGSGESARALIGGLATVEQAVPVGSTADIDTMEQARQLGFASPLMSATGSLIDNGIVD
ncbi:MAG: NTP transferase domain-containing protein [Propionibacteriaceae bacterium]|jgi:molybdopterin-guanine dinucleotide biosynthesis protein A|nr:NTP transferase domain-containing protein [Propionibacteriaceae bacterium]